jgi:hypothetical protein
MFQAEDFGGEVGGVLGPGAAMALQATGMPAGIWTME